MHDSEQGLADRDCEEAKNVAGDIETEDEELKIDQKRAQTKKYQTQDIVTSSEVQDMMGAEMEKSTLCPNAPEIAGKVKEKMFETPQFSYAAVEEGVKTPLTNLEEESLVHIFQQGRMDSVLMRNTQGLTQSDLSMDALTRQVGGWWSLITPVTVHLQHHINKIGGEHCLAQRLLKQFLEISNWLQFVAPKTDAGVVTSLTITPSEAASNVK